MFGWFAVDSETSAQFSFADLYHAWQRCRKGKRGTLHALAYELQLLDQLLATQQRLNRCVWRPSHSVCFVTTRPKAREIHAAPFADRVVHHLLVGRLELLFEPVFIYDSFANRCGKGTHAAVNRLQTLMRRVSYNGCRSAWFVQFDIRNFFNSIQRSLLLQFITRRLTIAVKRQQLTAVQAQQLFQLSTVILDHCVAGKTHYCGSQASFKRVPPHKRLHNAPAGVGLPIGNLTSQFFANVYLNELDQFVKHQLAMGGYVRYVDDFIIIHHNKAELLSACQRIEQFLLQQLQLTLRDPIKVQSLNQGADFLGYIVRPHYRLVRRRVVKHLYQKLDTFQGQYLTAVCQGWQLGVTIAVCQKLQAVLASYLGHFSHANSYHLCASLWKKYTWLKVLFNYENGKLKPRWQPRSVTSLRSQFNYFTRCFPQNLVLMQVGNVVEVYGCQAKYIEKTLNFKLLPLQRQGRHVARQLPLAQLATLRHYLQRHQQGYLFVSEQGVLSSGHKRRSLRLLWTPNDQFE